MSSLHEVKAIVDGEPAFEPALPELKLHDALRVLTANEYISEQQRRWYKGVCLPQLARYDENGETQAWWDMEVKKLCNGLEYLKKEIFILEDGMPVGRLTTKGVSRKNMTLFVEEILSKSIQFGWPVAPPDPTLRSK